MIKTHVRKGDLVEVTAGNHKGSRGKILNVFPKDNRVKIEGVGMIFKHKKIDKQNNTGGRTQEEGKIHISNVALIDPESDKPGRTKTEVIDGKKTRVFTKSGKPVGEG